MAGAGTSVRAELSWIGMVSYIFKDVITFLMYVSFAELSGDDSFGNAWRGSVFYLSFMFSASSLLRYVGCHNVAGRDSVECNGHVETGGRGEGGRGGSEAARATSQLYSIATHW